MMMKTKALTLASLTLTPFSLKAELVPGGDFEVYKPG